ncbi:hypothetical protein LCGC14_2322110 [marine sediment metagenome]|uniref:Uncharacterized protein n=1 Tax=marine sediment metagenome TaxID=412755 RepID=A0A0F9CHL6_9ZZZZ
MNDIPYPLTILVDRYSGAYSGGQWTAWNLEPFEIPPGPTESDMECSDFWADNEIPVGRGDTPVSAIASLTAALDAESYTDLGER